MKLAFPLALGLALLSSLGEPGLAAAPSEAERDARRSFQAAEGHFRAGLFAQALSEYQAGYDQAPLPGFLINIAQCHRRLGDLPKARATYQKFVMVAPDSPHVPEVKTLIAELDKLISELDGEAASARQTGESPPTSAVQPPPLALPPPAAAAAAPPSIAAPVSPIPAASAAPPHQTRWWLWSLVGVAVAGGTVAAFALGPSSSTVTVHEGTLGTLRR